MVQPKRRTARGGLLGNIFIAVFLGCFVFLTIYPLWHVIMYSLSGSRESMSGGLFFWPRRPTLHAYEMILQTKQIFVAYKNTILKTLGGTAISMALTIMTAYPLALPRFKGGKAISLFIFFTMLFNAGIIPNYLVIKQFGLLDTFWVYVLPGAVSAYNLFILRTYFRSIPASLEESAYIDGANSLQILAKIVLPLSKPAIAALIMFYGVTNWNSYMDGVLYVNTTRLQLLQLYLRELINAAGARVALSDAAGLSGAVNISEETMKMTVISISIIPVIAVYPLLQRYYAKGAMMGSVKE